MQKIIGPKPAITSFTFAELEKVSRELDEPEYRARQILDWVYQKGVTSFEAMTNLPKNTRLRFTEQFVIFTSQIKRIATGQDGTKKSLIQLFDNSSVESVLMSARRTKTLGQVSHRITLCISTQVGCPVRCRFCASGLKGLIRSLHPNEIVEQVLLAQNFLKPVRLNSQLAGKQGTRPDPKVNNIVIMGMGEPFLNYDNLIKSLTIITAKWGLGIGTNRITVSTVGVPHKITQFAKEKVATNLAISLHASNDRIRRRLIPLAERFNIQQILKAARRYRQITGKDVTLEYLMIEGLNTNESSARELVRLLKGSRTKINLIPYNPVKNLSYHTPSFETIKQFQNILSQAGLVATLRRSKGNDIDAACGQLALRSNIRNKG